MNQPSRTERSQAAEEPFCRFSLAELMGGVAVAALNCAVWKLHHASGFIAMVFLLPSSYQFMHATRFCRKMGIPLTPAEYGWSLSFACWTGLIAAGAYFASMMIVLFFVSPMLLNPRYFIVMPTGSTIVLLLASTLSLPVPIGIVDRFSLRPALRAIKERESQSKVS